MTSVEKALSLFNIYLLENTYFVMNKPYENAIKVYWVGEMKTSNIPKYEFIWLYFSQYVHEYFIEMR